MRATTIRLMCSLALITGAAPAVCAATGAPEGRWYAVQLHAHSTYSDGRHSPRELIRWAKEGGLDALAMSEHNTNTQLADAVYAEQQDVLLIPSYEWTSPNRPADPATHQGHANIWGLKPDTALLSAKLSAREVAAAAKAQGLTIGVNHPFEPRYSWGAPDFAGVDTIEVWHWQWHFDEEASSYRKLSASERRVGMDLNQMVHRNGHALESWQAALRRGERVTPIAVSDFHVVGIQQLESPCTLVWSREKSVEALLASLRAGHVTLAETPHGPRVELWADGDGDGGFEAMTGDTVKPGSRLRVKVTNAPGMRVTLHDDQGVVWRAEAEGNEWTRDLPDARARFYWARLDSRRLVSPLRGMTGALFIGASASEQGGSGI